MSEQRLALLFAVGGMICLFLAAGVSVIDSPTRRSQAATQRVAAETVRERADRRVQRLSARLLPVLQEGRSRDMQAMVELAAQVSPEVIEIGMVDSDQTVLACSDPARVGKTIGGPVLKVVQESAARGEVRESDDPAGQRVLVAAPIGRPQALARLYVIETTAGVEDDLNRLVVVHPARVPVWLTILLGFVGLATALLLFMLADRRQVLQAVRVQEVLEQMSMGYFEARLDPAEVPQLFGVAQRVNALGEQVQLIQEAQLEDTLQTSRLKEELQHAQVVQQTLMPDVRRIARGPLQLCGVYRSVSRLSGDWWNYYALDDHRTLLVLADVLGHGIGAAVVGAMAFGCAAQLHQDLQGNLRPDLLLQRFNRAIWTTTRGKYTMSCFAAIVDTEKNLLTYASGAHAFPLLYRLRDAQKPFVPLVVPGAPLGSSEAPEFTASTQPFEAGDLLVCYTDGLVEAANANGDPFGDKRVRQTVQRAAGRNVEEICELLLNEVSRFVGSAKLDDDQTLVVARNLPASAASSSSWSNPT